MKLASSSWSMNAAAETVDVLQPSQPEAAHAEVNCEQNPEEAELAPIVSRLEVSCDSSEELSTCGKMYNAVYCTAAPPLPADTPTISTSISS